MIVVPYAESDIDSIAGEQRRLLQPFSHVPTQSVEDDLASQVTFPVSVLSSQRNGLRLGHSRNPITPSNFSAVGMAARCGQDRRSREFGCLTIVGEQGRFIQVLSRSEFQLDVLIFQDSWRSRELGATNGEYRFGIAHSVWFQQLKSLK